MQLPRSFLNAPEFLIPHSPPAPAQQGPGENLSTSSQECRSGIRGKETVRPRWPKRITSQGLSLKRYPTQKKPSAKPSLCPAEPVLGSRMNNGFVSCRILSYSGVASVRGSAAVCFLCFPLIGLETGEQRGAEERARCSPQLCGFRSGSACST